MKYRGQETSGQSSLRKSGQRLSQELRAKISKLAGLLDPDRWYGKELSAKHFADDDWGREASEALKRRDEEIPRLWQQLQSELPKNYFDFISPTNE